MLTAAVVMTLLYAATGRLLFAALAAVFYLSELLIDRWAADDRLEAAERRGFSAGVVAARDHVRRAADPDSPYAPTDRRRPTDEER